ncbi:hypothetical protein KAZ93_02665 [Patescibacteria group bacterium]|nr:hypothetical protein [Patescibacteria group bacterium]
MTSSWNRDMLQCCIGFRCIYRATLTREEELYRLIGKMCVCDLMTTDERDFVVELFCRVDSYECGIFSLCDIADDLTA